MKKVKLLLNYCVLSDSHKYFCFRVDTTKCQDRHQAISVSNQSKIIDWNLITILITHMTHLSMRAFTAHSLGSKNTQSNPSKQRKLEAFPIILHRILSDPRFSSIIAWARHGCAWKVINRGRFLQEIVPQFFNLTHFKSFLRQVSGWGFIRIVEGEDKGCYYHSVSYYVIILPNFYSSDLRAAISESKA